MDEPFMYLCIFMLYYWVGPIYSYTGIVYSSLRLLVISDIQFFYLWRNNLSM